MAGVTEQQVASYKDLEPGQQSASSIFTIIHDDFLLVAAHDHPGCQRACTILEQGSNGERRAACGPQALVADQRKQRDQV